MDNILFGAVMFMGFLFLFSASFLGTHRILYAENTTALFQNNTNVTIIGGQGGNQVPQFPVCNMGNNIIENIVGTGSCIASGIGWLFSMLTFRSDYQWLTVIFVGVGAVILYRIIRILKPTGGS